MYQPNRSPGRSRIAPAVVTASLVVIALVVAAMPGMAANNAGNKTSTVEVFASGDFGNLGAQWGSDGNNYVYVFGGTFHCDASGSDIAMPEYKKAGVDRVLLTMSIASSDFASCQGDPPDEINVDIEVLADYVVHEVSSNTTKVIKGDGFETSTTYNGTHGSGSVTGTFQDVPIEGTSSGYFAFHHFVETGPPAPATTP